MLEQELLVKLVGALESNNIPYMLTGSYVSSLQGQPRSTYDIDVVVEIHEQQLAEFLNAFPVDEYYRDKESIIDALMRQSHWSKTYRYFRRQSFPDEEIIPSESGSDFVH